MSSGTSHLLARRFEQTLAGFTALLGISVGWETGLRWRNMSLALGLTAGNSLLIIFAILSMLSIAAAAVVLLQPSEIRPALHTAQRLLLLLAIAALWLSHRILWWMPRAGQGM